ncbi:MAG TPA: hypothetical protein VNJ12_00290, partial [Candidatus Dormibacteraeota bacterium]|nr:hypothetical protein [Candidatus Dormibacteraeota bacterium]
MKSVSRRALAVILFGALAVLALFAASPRSPSGLPRRVASLGFVDSTTGAMLSGARAVAGSTVFNGDGVKVLPAGRLGVTLAGGSRAFFGPGTDANLVRNGAAV